MRKSPCLECDERHIACHSTCKKYLEFRAKLDEINEKRKEEVRNRDADIDRCLKLAKFKKKGMR